MSAKSIVLKWGLIGGSVTIIMGLMSYLLGMTDSKIFQYIGIVLMLAIIILGLFEYRDKFGSGFASFGELFKVGLMIGLVMALISVVWTYVFMTFIDPEMMGRILLKTEIELENQGLSDKEVKMALDMTTKFISPKYMAIIGLASSFTVNGIISLISAFVIKNEKPLA